MNKLLNLIDIAICSTLDKRYEQASELIKTSKSYLPNYLNVEPYIGGDGSRKDIVYNRIDNNEYPPRLPYSINYPTWWNRPNNYNAWKCHRDMFQKGYDSNAEVMLMLEDDAQFEPDFTEIMNKVDSFFMSTEWDLIYLGSYINKSSETENEHVLRLWNGGGTHGLLIRRHILEILINMQPIGPFDWVLSLIQPQIKAYAIYPSIITQRSGYSHIEGNILEKPDRYKK